MSKPFLAAVDLAQPDRHLDVLKTAMAMARLGNTSLAVVTVIPDYSSSYVGSFFPEDRSQNALEETRTALHSYVRETLGDDKSIQHVVRMGSAYKEVLLTAEELDASMLVVGAQEPDVLDYLVGPNAARIVRHANCSVHVCRTPNLLW